MDWNRIEGNWKQFKGRAKEKSRASPPAHGWQFSEQFYTDATRPSGLA
jgi:hypothetical protein